jgi:hypothetical protein
LAESALRLFEIDPLGGERELLHGPERSSRILRVYPVGILPVRRPGTPALR